MARPHTRRMCGLADARALALVDQRSAWSEPPCAPAERPANGAVLRVIGTGNVSRHVDRVPIGRVGFLPSDVEPAGGGLLISQTEPIPVGQRTLATLIRLCRPNRATIEESYASSLGCGS